MELKDMILQTLTEIEENPKNTESPPIKPKNTPNISSVAQEESSILYALREKALVLFEGLQSTDESDLSKRLDLVINYLQYQLSIIDEKLQV